VNDSFKRVILDTIRNAKPLQHNRYVYSDLSFYLYPDIISRLTGVPYEDYLSLNFFRQERLRGFVHDEGAAVMGGVSGHAGLFGTTIDLAKLFQMYLQKGFFGGKRFIAEETVDEFTRTQFIRNKNRRGLGFDKPLIDNHKNNLTDAFPAISASKNSYGHTGYTGTMAWADPDNGLLFIFMSNRVHPTRENFTLSDLNIRTAMHQAIYDCLGTGNTCK